VGHVSGFRDTILVGVEQVLFMCHVYMTRPSYVLDMFHSESCRIRWSRDMDGGRDESNYLANNILSLKSLQPIKPITTTPDLYNLIQLPYKHYYYNPKPL